VIDVAQRRTTDMAQVEFQRGPPAIAWPAAAALVAGRFASRLLDDFMAPVAESAGPPLAWTMANDVVIELPTLRLRRFRGDAALRPTLVCAPFALHDAHVADFAPGHSLVAALAGAGLGPIYLIEWRSATPCMRFHSIDTLLADLNVAVDEIEQSINLVGICQGGWMSAVYAARFPSKVAKLVLAGAPIDIDAEGSPFSQLAQATSLSAFKNLVDARGGLVVGRDTLNTWQMTRVSAANALADLQIRAGASHRPAMERYRQWHETTLDLPGQYYLEVAERLYHKNQIATGTFVALGKRIDLAAVHCASFLLAARGDQIVAPQQVLAVRHLIGTPPGDIEETTTAGTHLSLFMGRKTLTQTWPKIAAWLIRQN
jgi:poly(3-hydroxyalkanoate) synthetase